MLGWHRAPGFCSLADNKKHLSFSKDRCKTCGTTLIDTPEGRSTLSGRQHAPCLLTLACVTGYSAKPFIVPSGVHLSVPRSGWALSCPNSLCVRWRFYLSVIGLWSY